MGGNAFIRPGGNGRYPALVVPRMRPETYEAMSRFAITTLQKFFKHVAVPRSLPGKPDHGDVDTFVGGWKCGDRDENNRYVRVIQDGLGAPRAYDRRIDDGWIYFAVPSPEYTGEGPQTYVQIDVQVCKKPKFFKWELFRLEYASLPSMILGSLGGPLGLTLNSEGLYVRVEGLEKVNHNGSLILLTRDPMETLKFFGLDTERYGKFETIEELYRWLVSSPAFELNPTHFEKRWEDGEYRQRVQEHPTYSNFLSTWLPTYLKEAITDPRRINFLGDEIDDYDAKINLARRVVLNWVSEAYPDARRIHDEKLVKHFRDSAEERIRELVKAAIPLPEPDVTLKDCPQVTKENAEPTSDPASTASGTITKSSQPIMGRAAAMRFILRWTIFDSSGKPQLVEVPSDDNMKNRWSESTATEEELIQWPKDVWDEIQRRHKARQDARYERDIKAGKVKPKNPKPEFEKDAEGKNEVGKEESTVGVEKAKGKETEVEEGE